MMSIQSYVIGTVKEIRGTNVVARLFGNSSQMIYFLNGERYSGVMIGSYIGIKRGHYTIVAKIEKEYAQDTLRDITTQEFSKDRFIREVEVKVLGSYIGGSYYSGIVAFPQIFNDVILLTDKQISTIISGSSPNLKVNTKFKDNTRFKMGEVWPEGIPFIIDWTTIFNTHVAIFGNTGSGKSNTLTRLYKNLFSLQKKGTLDFGTSKFVFIDFNGEYTANQVLTENKTVYELDTRFSENKSKNKIKIPGDKFWDKEMLSILFGATAQTQQPFLNRVVNYYFSKLDFEEKLSKYFCNAFKNVYNSPSKDSLDLLRYALKILEIEYNEVSEWITHSAFNPNNPNGYYSIKKLSYWKSNDNHKWYWNAGQSIDELEKEIEKINENLSRILIKEKIKNKIKNPIVQLRLATHFQMIFDLSHHAVLYDHIAPLIHRIEARTTDINKILEITSTRSDGDCLVTNETIFNEKAVHVISLKNVNRDMKMLIPMLIAKISYDLHRNQNMKSNVKENIFNLIVDEAHNILSEETSVESEKWKDYRLDVFEEIIKEGRKFGYYLTIASQRPADISPTIVSQIHNFFIHRLVNDNDLKLLDKAMNSLDYVSKSSIPNLSPGQAIVTGVSFDLPLIVKIDRLEKEEAPNSSNSELIEMWKVKEDSR